MPLQYNAFNTINGTVEIALMDTMLGSGPLAPVLQTLATVFKPITLPSDLWLNHTERKPSKNKDAMLHGKSVGNKERERISWLHACGFICITSLKRWMAQRITLWFGIKSSLNELDRPDLCPPQSTSYQFSPTTKVHPRWAYQVLLRRTWPFFPCASALAWSLSSLQFLLHAPQFFWRTCTIRLMQ